MIDIPPIPEDLYCTLIEKGVIEFELHWRGGWDESDLDVEINEPRWPWNSEPRKECENLIREWAWNSFPYSGAGDGSDYGDDLVYNLEKDTIHVSEWYQERVDHDKGEIELETEKEEPKEDKT